MSQAHAETADDVQSSSCFPDDFEWPDERDAELEDVVTMLRAASVKALLWGQERDMRLIDDLIERLERHEHRG